QCEGKALLMFQEGEEGLLGLRLALEKLPVQGRGLLRQVLKRPQILLRRFECRREMGRRSRCRDALRSSGRDGFTTLNDGWPGRDRRGWPAVSAAGMRQIGDFCLAVRPVEIARLVMNGHGCAGVSQTGKTWRPGSLPVGAGRPGFSGGRFRL